MGGQHPRNSGQDPGIEKKRRWIIAGTLEPSLKKGGENAGKEVTHA